MADGPPQAPYALHLTDHAHRYALVVFNFNVSGNRLTDVWRDAHTLTGMLNEAGLDHVVARSGPAGGLHIWVPVGDEEGLDPLDVAALGHAASAHLPSLDSHNLHNPATAAVRPPGSPHPDGGHCELLHPSASTDALTVFDTADNTAAKFASLLQAFDPALDNQPHTATGRSHPSRTEPARPPEQWSPPDRSTPAADPCTPRATARATQIWNEFTRWYAPRGRLRCDVRTQEGAWAHHYDKDVGVGTHPPQGPYAMYLADNRARFQFLVFDLDAKNGTEQVQQDTAFLSEHLDETGLAYIVAASGSRGGMHLWVPIVDPHTPGAPAHLIAQIAHAAAHHCPSLDTTPLLNPRAGCVRPPGAPHRSGTHSTLITPSDPITAAAYCDAAPNTLTRLENLARTLGPVPAPEHPSTTARAPLDPETVRLIGRARPMPATTEALLDQTPETDASAHLARILTSLALSRWSWDQVLTLWTQHPQAPGWEHLRTQATQTGRRPRTETAQRALLKRQWQRQVNYAASLPRNQHHSQDSSRVRTLVEIAWSIQQATALPQWWHSQSGSSDTKAIQFVALMALEALSQTVEIDGRRLAHRAGMVHSTAARALTRLVKDGRLTLVCEGEGRRAHTYRLISPDHWRVQQVRTLRTQGATQATPRPQHCPHHLTREALRSQLDTRFEHAANDVWAETKAHRGSRLGRHVEKTAAALFESTQNAHLYDIDSLTVRTGYTTATTRSHLRKLKTWGLTAPDTATGALRICPQNYETAAQHMGTSGTRARRKARYDAERRAWAHWVAEVETLRAPRALPARALTPHRSRYPRTVTGRPDHAAARRQAAAA